MLKLLKEIESEIPSDRGLAKTSALTVVVNKIPNISNLVKKKGSWFKNIWYWI